MRESELREWIEELAEEQGEKERQRGERLEREEQALEEREQRRFEQMKQELKDQSLDPEPLLELDETEVRDLEERREEQREELISQGEEVDLPNESPAFISGSTFQSTRSSTLRPYYVEIRGHFDRLEHSTYDPEPLDVTVDAAWSLRYNTVNWWFSFTPDQTKHWDFRVYTPYRGFYRLNVEGHWFFNPSSSAKITEEVRAHQYNPGPKETRSRLNLKTDDVDMYSRFDHTFTQNYGHLLTEGDAALLHVHQRFEARGGRTSGTHAEINFGTGTGNRLPVPYVYIS